MIIVNQEKDGIFNFERITNIWIDKEDYLVDIQEIKFEICADGETLGYYDTEERAEEVLQEIINAYKGKIVVQFNTFLKDEQLNELKKKFDDNHYIYDLKSELKSLNNTVYEMPLK